MKASVMYFDKNEYNSLNAFDYEKMLSFSCDKKDFTKSKITRFSTFSLSISHGIGS